MDQGAILSIILAITPNRYIAGIIENISKKFLSDRTNYRKMLIINNIKTNNLLFIKNKLYNYIFKNFIIYSKYLNINNKIYKFKYPILKNIRKIILFNRKKNNIIFSKLIGIKGQYLIFSNKTVINIRNFIGYIIDIIIY